MQDAKQNQEWEKLYKALREILSRHGTEDPYGEADYWLVDDNWGGSQHKVSVFKISFLTQALMREIQELLRKQFPIWSVVLALDITKDSTRIQDQGMTVYPDRIDEDWNRAQLRKTFGTEFKL